LRRAGALLACAAPDVARRAAGMQADTRALVDGEMARAIRTATI
jgi:hypothetical protein